ncbi:MAG: hypothetical protein LCI00_14020 [Chloroflexi bacterium]|nr:hypothetical protein [Chloroflexota bacterium]MCC6892218.1 hypothetical protein [Anaerolineae bacterium]
MRLIVQSRPNRAKRRLDDANLSITPCDATLDTMEVRYFYHEGVETND